MTAAAPSRRFRDTVRRVMIGVAWGLVPTLFVVGLLRPEGEMTGLAVALGILQRLLLVALAGAIVFVAGLFGMRVLRLTRIAPESLFARLILGAGLGIGTISLLTLAFGLAGLARSWTTWLILGAMFLAGLPEIRTIGDRLRSAAREPRPRLTIFELALLLAMLLVLSFQLLLAFNLPTDYDACEYHMAAPWRWAQLGRIDWVEGNVYTNLPMNAEMLHLFSMEIVGPDALKVPAAVERYVPYSGQWERLCFGVHLGVVMNMMTSLLATGAVWVLARRFWSRKAAFAASALFFTMPWSMVATTINIYNEVLLAFWATLAVYALLEFRETKLVRWLVLSAIFAGLAAGVKYTAAGFFPPVLLVAGIIVLWKSSRLKAVGAGILAAAVVLAALSPWLAKNQALAGNPVFPFGYTWFGGRDWSPELDWKWYAGNMKAAGADKAGNLFAATLDRVVLNKWGSLAIAAFALFALTRIGTAKRSEAGWLWVLMVLWTLLWYFGTHRVDRFWLPIAGVAAALAGCGFASLSCRGGPMCPPSSKEEGGATRGWPPTLAAVLLFLGLAWQLTVNSLIFGGNVAGNYDLMKGNGAFLEKRCDIARLVAHFASGASQENSLMLVGEARSLYLTADCRYSTAFNREIFTSMVGDLKDIECAKNALRQSRVQWVFVNWFEVGRLRESYGVVAPDGHEVEGFPPLSPTDFARFERAGFLSPVVGAFGQPVFPRAPRVMRGIPEEDMKHLPDGEIAVLYRVH